tara:strand:+ start:239 stop:421 length:183 start_codon:yes stop_codon:yes gene_type:complete
MLKNTNKEKLKKEYNKIVGKQIHNNDIPDDMYPIMRDVLSAGLEYIPAKVLKEIIKKNEN